MSETNHNTLVEAIQQLGFSTDILFPLIYSEKLVVKYKNIQIESPFYKYDQHKTINALKKRLAATVDQNSVDLFINFFTAEYLKFEKSQLEAAATSPPPPRRSLYARLSPTYNVKLWIERQVRQLSEQIGLSENERPTIIFTTEELRTMPVKMTVKEIKKCFGVCIPETRTIFVHVKKHSAYDRVKDTIIRGLAYYRFRDLDDARLEEIVTLIKSGRKYSAASIDGEKIPPSVIY